MTAPELLAYISVALFVQLAAGVAVALWRRGGRAAKAPISIGVEVASERTTELLMAKNPAAVLPKRLLSLLGPGPGTGGAMFTVTLPGLAYRA